MLGPHSQKIAQLQQRFTTQHMMTRMQNKLDNPLNNIIDKLKRQFSEYDTAYTDDIINHQISSVDRVLSFDGKMGPILSGLQKQNQLLRKEISLMQTQLSSAVSYCEQLIGQNKQLKQMLKKKNEDLLKIIDTIAHNQSSVRDELQSKISLLQHQNSILLKHLDQLKQGQASHEAILVQKQQQSINWQRKWQQCKTSLANSINHERQLSRKIANLQQNHYQQQQMLYELQKNNQTLKFECNEMKNKLMVGGDRKILQAVQLQKTKMNEQYDAIVEQHRILKRQRMQFLRQAEKGKIDLSRNMDNINVLQNQLGKIKNQLQLTTSLLNQQRIRNNELVGQRSRLEQQLNEMKDGYARIQLDLQSNNSYIQNKERLLQREISDLRKTLEEKSIDFERRLKEIKDKMKGLLDSKDIEIRNLNDTNIELRRAMERQQGGRRE